MGKVNETERINEYTGYRENTRNLVIAGAEHFLKKVRGNLKAKNIHTIEAKTALPYDQIPSIIEEGGKSLVVYLVHTDDIFGGRLRSLKKEVQPFLESFDSVHGLFWIGGESSGELGQTTIKHHGEYVGFYKK